MEKLCRGNSIIVDKTQAKDIYNDL